ncbi:MAG: polyprenyl synthetase family protein [Planctomycetota bacterium]
MRLLDQNQLDDLEAAIDLAADRCFIEPGLESVRATVARFIRSGGKRIRPQLCLWTYRHLGGTDDVAALDLASGWELFHAFLLVHDDIIDGSDVRRDQSALHRQLAGLDSNCVRFGTNLGIVVGDLLFSGALETWHGIDTELTRYRDLLRLLSRVATVTGFGQAGDIIAGHTPLDRLSEERLLRDYAQKTAAYTFEGPMLSAAILAGSDADVRAAVSRFALAIGQAYQLQNDLLDLAAPVHDGSDIAQGKRTVTMLRASRDIHDLSRRLDAIANANGDRLALAESLRSDVLTTTAVGDTRSLITEHLGVAEASAADCGNLRRPLGHFLAGLRETYFADNRVAEQRN